MVTTYSLVKNSHSHSSLRQGLFPFGDCSQVFFVGVLIVSSETYEEKRWRTLKAIVPVQVQIVAVSELAPVLVLRRMVKHWGLLLLWESDQKNSREKNKEKHTLCLCSAACLHFPAMLKMIIALHFEMEHPVS